MCIRTINVKLIKQLLPSLLILVFVMFKISDLCLPYFSDEAWSYSPAIAEMAKKGPSLIPNAIDPEFYRGHPMLFYCIGASWIHLFGSEIWVLKLLALLISIVFLNRIFNFTKTFFDFTTATLTLVFLVIQSVFFAQSSFVLPEIILALFTTLSLNAYLQKKRWQTVIFLTLALFIKESAIIIYLTIGLFELAATIKNKDLNVAQKIQSMLYLLIPGLCITTFFISQKLIVGWYFFPEHIAFLSFDSFFNRLNGYFTYLFIFMGRNLLTFTGFFALIFLIIKKDRDLLEKKKALWLLSGFILFYLLFSSVNFFSPRYLLSILPFTILIGVYAIKRALSNYHVSVAIGVFSLLFINNLYFTISNKGGDDHTLGYRDLIEVHEKMVHYCEAKKLYDKPIFTHFLMLTNLTNSSLGYLNGKSLFTNSSMVLISQAQFALISSVEFNPTQYEGLLENGKIVKRFEKNKCWIELIEIHKTKAD
jgi:4-amino-4-deoxy-L-arabinose transferase-like glycosyltransferase